MFKLEFNTGNAAFTDERTHEYDDYYKREEICRILDVVKEGIRNGYTEKNVGDFYGNIVGKWELN